MDKKHLDLVGMTEEEYNKLTPEARSYVDGRASKLERLRNIGHVAELLTVMAEEVGPENTTLLQPLVDGNAPDVDSKIMGIVEEFNTAGVEGSIKDFYKIKYAGRARELLTSEGGIQQPSPLQPPAQASVQAAPSVIPVSPAATSPPAPPAPPAATIPLESAPPAVTPVPQVPPAPSGSKGTIVSQAFTEAQARPSAALTVDSRPAGNAPLRKKLSDIAKFISKWENRDVKDILAAESNLLTRIVVLSEKHKNDGVTVESICLAAEHMVDDQFHDARLHREALDPQHEEELVKRAKTLFAKKV